MRNECRLWLLRSSQSQQAEGKCGSPAFGFLVPQQLCAGISLPWTGAEEEDVAHCINKCSSVRFPMPACATSHVTAFLSHNDVPQCFLHSDISMDETQSSQYCGNQGNTQLQSRARGPCTDSPKQHLWGHGDSRAGCKAGGKGWDSSILVSEDTQTAGSDAPSPDTPLNPGLTVLAAHKMHWSSTAVTACLQD